MPPDLHSIAAGRPRSRAVRGVMGFQPMEVRREMSAAIGTSGDIFVVSAALAPRSRQEKIMEWVEQGLVRNEREDDTVTLINVDDLKIEVENYAHGE